MLVESVEGEVVNRPFSMYLVIQTPVTMNQPPVEAAENASGNAIPSQLMV
ncbi:MAG: hypothetical protein QGF78_05875 [Candidatus Bathyarchaeota archaeon]|nr:hypothetical protein [Candidatus Bathyarchaeota archaeon]